MGGRPRDRRSHSARGGGLRRERGFFSAPGGAGDQPRERRPPAADAWADVIHRLVSAGHRYPDLLNYTLVQVRCFLATSDRAEREALAVQFALLVTAQRGDRSEIQSLLRELGE